MVAMHRPWGGGYWFQNVRHSYWYALNAGDFDLLTPLFDMYLKQMPVLEERSRQWWNHTGSQVRKCTTTNQPTNQTNKHVKVW